MRGPACRPCAGPGHCLSCALPHRGCEINPVSHTWDVGAGTQAALAAACFSGCANTAPYPCTQPAGPQLTYWPVHSTGVTRALQSTMISRAPISPEVMWVESILQEQPGSTNTGCKPRQDPAREQAMAGEPAGIGKQRGLPTVRQRWRQTAASWRQRQPAESEGPVTVELGAQA